MDSIKVAPETFKILMERCALMEDKEKRHVLADKLMMSVLIGLGYIEGVEIFADMGKWYA
jgi:hypothetical protein